MFSGLNRFLKIILPKRLFYRALIIVATPFKTAEFDILYGTGISKIGEIIDICVETDVIKKSGSWFSYGETKLGQGKEAVKKLLEDNPELLEELESRILKSIN